MATRVSKVPGMMGSWTYTYRYADGFVESFPEADDGRADFLAATMEAGGGHDRPPREPVIPEPRVIEPEPEPVHGPRGAIPW